jgi:prepilin-type N-terminal cleavage/methylation domain-containing protein
MRKINHRNQKGFSLLEVILAITILATLAVISTQAITRALRARDKIQAEVEDVSALRDSLRMFRQDITLAFHHRDFEKELNDLAAKSASSTTLVPGNAPTPAVAPPPRQTKRHDPGTDFVGDESNVNLVTLNSGRMSSAVVQADFIEVGYSLRDCNNLTTNKTSRCLYRRVQNIIDEDVKTGGNEIVMLENVSEFKLRYIGETKQDWVNEWNSTASSSDGGTRGRYPDAVEVSLTIERLFEGKTKSYSMQLVVPIHFPNNPPSKGSTLGATGTDGSGAGTLGGQIDQ